MLQFVGHHKTQAVVLQLVVDGPGFSLCPVNRKSGRMEFYKRVEHRGPAG